MIRRAAGLRLFRPCAAAPELPFAPFMTPSRLILVAVIGAPHGVRGEIRLKTYTERPETVGTIGALTDADGRRRFEITAFRLLKDDMAVIRLAGVADRTAAEALKGTRLFVRREQLPPPQEDEVYVADLVGLHVETEAGAVVGTVRGVANYGGGDLLEVAPPTGDTLLVPFLRAFVPVVDIAGGRVVITEAAIALDEADEEAPDPSGAEGPA